MGNLRDDFVLFETEPIKRTEHNNDLLREEPNKPNICCVIFVCSFGQGLQFMPSQPV